MHAATQNVCKDTKIPVRTQYIRAKIYAKYHLKIIFLRKILYEVSIFLHKCKKNAPEVRFLFPISGCHTRLTDEDA